MKQFNVLSLFDGCSMGRLALHTMGIEVSNYYASEVDKYSEGVSRVQFPDIIRLGDVNKIDFSKLPRIDLLIAGFPCQSFSFSGSQKGLNEDRGKLFYKVLEALQVLQPKYFLFENVKMKKEYQETITKLIWENVDEDFYVYPINSSLVSAQNRQRIYWTNIPLLHTIKDKGILLKDIVTSGTVDRDKAYCVDANYYKGGDLRQYLTKKRRQIVYSSPEDIKQTKYLEKDKIRMLSVNECERLQTLPDNYTEMGEIEGVEKTISNTQRYKMIGNGFTIDIIMELLKGMRSSILNQKEYPSLNSLFGRY